MQHFFTRQFHIFFHLVFPKAIISQTFLNPIIYQDKQGFPARNSLSMVCSVVEALIVKHTS